MGKKKDIKNFRTRIKMAFRRVIAGIARKTVALKKVTINCHVGTRRVGTRVKIVHCRLI
jgi:hypothetical protein